MSFVKDNLPDSYISTPFYPHPAMDENTLRGIDVFSMMEHNQSVKVRLVTDAFYGKYHIRKGTIIELTSIGKWYIEPVFRLFSQKDSNETRKHLLKRIPKHLLLCAIAEQNVVLEVVEFKYL